ncbi:diguanylate cyclase [Pseudidiomarina sp. GXY010]|uniref:diguanylate cyclase n=1 Tax=Pseudidiomarina fusca TaxID=2965078 RepID=A0ABU3KY65_9GAMM|nr:diguanylate cyclase [Pseudidiomarina sp. GXY010]MDT7525868.1 diguanylate cyclase [Pseudidiomarina sp. GXY010]
MIKPPLPANEEARLQLLHELNLLDSEADPLYDSITAFAQQLFGVDTAIITLVDEHRQWFKSVQGFDLPETPRDISFCGHAITQQTTMIVEDASQDERFHDNPLVAANDGIRFYAGVPLTLNDDLNIGTLCLIDSRPRQLSPQQQQWLEGLAAWVVHDIVQHYELENFAAEREVLAQGPVAAVVWQLEPDVHLVYAAENVERILGYSADYLLDLEINYESIVHPDDQQQLLDQMQLVLDGIQPSLEIEYRVVPPSQHMRWVKHFARADLDRHGKVMRVRGYLYENTSRKQLELDLLNANQSFELALAAGDLSTWDWNLAEGTVSVNHTWDKILNRDSSFAQNNGWAELIHPADIATAKSQLIEHLQGHSERFEARIRLQHADGHYIWLHTVGKAVERNASGRVTRMVGIHHDVTEQVENELKQHQQEAILSLVSQVQHEFLFVEHFSEVCDIALPELMSLSQSKLGFIGELPEQSRHRNMLRVHGYVNRLNGSQQATQALIRQGLEVVVSGSVVSEVLLRGDPELCPYPVAQDELKFTPIELPQLDNAIMLPLYFKREVVGLLILAHSARGYFREDLAWLQPMLDTLGTLMHIRRIDQERRFVVEELRRMATRDELTGVANRRVFLEAAQQRKDESERYDLPMSVAIIDLDFFKKVNDSFGHAAGDEVLREFCRLAKQQLRDTDLLARLGGEEFGILFAHAELAQAMQGIERVRKAIAEHHFNWDDKRIPVTISAGVAQLVSADPDVDKWVARADEALYLAKEQGRNRAIAAS